MHLVTTSAMSMHTPSENRNAESVNIHMNIRPVAILEELLVRWQLVQAVNHRFDYDNCFQENLDYMPKSEF